MRENPRLKILNVAGLYDLATPFFGAEYDLGHMALEPQVAANIRYTYYPAGPHDVHRPAFGAAAQGRRRGLLRERRIGK